MIRRLRTFFGVRCSVFSFMSSDIFRMLKRFSRRRSILESQTSYPILFTQLTSSPLFFIRRCLSHSPCKEEVHDPRFSQTPKQSPSRKNKSTSILKKNTPLKVANKNSCINANDFPLKPELTFDFMYSYSENSPGVEPIGFREPRKFSPFGPGRIDREWTGTFAPTRQKPDLGKLAEERERVLGEPLSEAEIAELVEEYRHTNCSRQINLGKGGFTHNALDDIHNHWKRAEAVRIKCLGAPTLDMDNVCFHLECVCRTKQEGRLSTVT